MNNVPSWSYTALSQFGNCPRQYWLAKVAKTLPFTESEPMRYGNMRHKQIEDRLVKGTKLPKELEKMEPIFAKLEKAVMNNQLRDVQAELEFVFDRDLQMIHSYGQRSPKPFFMEGAWFRSKFDMVVLKDDTAMQITDWKFGKFRPDNDQLELFAAAGFQALPKVEMVKTTFVYPDLGKTKHMTFFRDGGEESDVCSPLTASEIWAKWLAKVERLNKAYKEDNWPCRPSGLCGWCDATPKMCPHSKK